MNKFMYFLVICLAFLTSSCLASYPYNSAYTTETALDIVAPASYPLYFPYSYGYNGYYGRPYYHQYPLSPRPIIVNPRPVVVPRPVIIAPRPNMGGFNHMSSGYGRRGGR